MHRIPSNQCGSFGHSSPLDLSLMDYDESNPGLIAQICDFAESVFFALDAFGPLDLEHQAFAIGEGE